MTDTQISRYDEAHIRDMAVAATEHLNERGYAEVVLTPGDATVYNIVILPPNRQVATKASHWMPRHRDFMVCLNNEFGKSYEWSGQTLHPSYCGAKWALSYHHAVGEVMSRFLNYLAPMVADLIEHEPADV